jgi:hypothetical protein
MLGSRKILLEENNPLFDSLVNKLGQFPELISLAFSGAAGCLCAG